MLFPKKVKYRKWHTMRKHPSKRGVASRGTTVAFGSYGLKATSHFRVRSNQLESARKVLARCAGKTGKFWLRVFPDMPFTQKPAEVKLGKGKGDPVGYQVQIKPGQVLFEIDGLEASLAREALRKAGTKLPLKTKIIERV
ncbi:MAG: 50S ribosomal protein L16 [Patescibacteria group bacterium]|mgnify:CR=1 FL=1